MSPDPKVRTSGGKSGTSVIREPFEHLIQHIKQEDPMLYEALKRVSYGVNSISNDITNNTSVSGPPIPLQRTLLIKDTTPGTDIADHIVIYGNGGPYTARHFFAVLRKAISANLTVKVHHKLGGVDTIIGSFTIPSTQAIDTPIDFTIANQLQHKAVLTWDITASDSSTDADGVASFTLVWF